MVWFLEPEASNIGYLDPLGIFPYIDVLDVRVERLLCMGLPDARNEP